MSFAPGFEARLKEVAGRVEARLDQIFSSAAASSVPPRLLAAMRHAVLGGGKRIRPFIVIESARQLSVAEDQAIETACAVELIHCYSLVHDDLPAMDNDDMRRGRPTVHKAFDEATAILAGDALQALAFERLAAVECHPDPLVRAELVLALSQAAGAAGMCGGQQLDLEAEERRDGPLKTRDGVEQIQRLKTGAVIRFAAEAGGILGRAPPAGRAALRAYGEALGAAFQIADDLLDTEGDAGTVGKATGKDEEAGKATFVSLLGIEGARARLAAEGWRALTALARINAERGALGDLVAFNAARRS